LSVVQVRQPLFVRLSDGRIQNSYELHIENKTDQPVKVVIMLRGLAGAELDIGKLSSIEVGPQRSLRVHARVRWDSGHKLKGSRSFEFNIVPQTRREIGMVSAPATFYLPGSEN